MPHLAVFESLSLDGFFCGPGGDLRWAHRDPHDEEWNGWVAQNARTAGPLVMGRKTHDMMASFWPTPSAKEFAPQTAEGMNARPKLVFSRTVTTSPWNNTTFLGGDAVAAMRQLKQQDGPNLVILGSGSLVSQFAAAGLINRYQFAIIPVALGQGRSLFPDLKTSLNLTLLESRTFKNGTVVVSYAA